MIRAAGYCRVSTDREDQANSFEAQQRYFRDYIGRQDGWELYGIYADATVIIGLKQNPTNGRRFSPIFFALSGILWGKTQDATMNQGGKQNTVRAKAFAVYQDNERLFLYPKTGGRYERND